MIGTTASILSEFLLAKFLQIGVIVLLALLLLRLAGGVAGTVRRRYVERPAIDAARRARLSTLLDAGLNGVRVFVLFLAGLMILSVVGIRLEPVLASVGVVALAVSLGAQTLIKDFIGGLLILAEDQFRVGDVVQIGDASGSVEQITLRSTQVRDVGGRVIIVPNGDVRVVANASKTWARAIVDLNLSFDADIGRVAQALDTAMARAQVDPEIAPHLLEPPQVLPWSGFNDWSVQVRLMAKTVAGKQPEVSRVLRRHALAALGEAGAPIAIPVQGPA
jgi:small conductance mechanosensitive channel